MKNYKISGIWVGPPEGMDLKAWMNEVVAISGIDEHLEPTGYVLRYQLIERVRKNGRESGKSVENPSLTSGVAVQTLTSPLNKIVEY